ncbi:hypothetical protein Kisp02_43260 [Kineosporia sp. NBRC 101731]|nr:hypothetical protein Kisp02_43260 [Kineosporia sp. NBRC 101731]
MIVDEMDLASRALEVEPLRPQAHEQARAKLRDEMARSVPAGTVVRLRRPRRVRRFAVTGLGALVASVAVVFAVVSTSSPTTPGGPVTGASASPVIESQLVALASRITAATAPASGDASLVIRSQKIGDGSAEVSYNLYTDAGDYYAGGDETSLAQAISAGEEYSDGIYAREVEAALYAVDGDLDTARAKMVNAAPNAFGLGLSEAERQKIWDRQMKADAEIYRLKGYEVPEHPPTGQELENLVGNRLWINGMDALSAGAGDPQVRAGVLRLLSSVPAVSVEETTTHGDPTLTLSAGPDLFSGGASEVLTIDAQTGIPITSSSRSLEKGADSSRSTYRVSRVTVADLTGGKS